MTKDKEIAIDKVMVRCDHMVKDVDGMVVAALELNCGLCDSRMIKACGYLNAASAKLSRAASLLSQVVNQGSVTS